MQIYGISRILIHSDFRSFTVDFTSMKMDPTVRLAGILIACPFGSPLKDCVFAPIRQKTLMNRIHWLHTLTVREKNQLAFIHNCCLSRREADFRNENPQNSSSDEEETSDDV